MLRFGVGHELVELVGDGGEFDGRGRVCALVGRCGGEFGLLAAEVVQARLEARQPFVTAPGGERALFERFVVALERPFGADDLGPD